MSDYITYRNNGVIYVATTASYRNINKYDGHVASNDMMRIYKNKESKIIVCYSGAIRSGQIVLEHKELYPKNKEIDAKYLKEEYLPKLEKIMENELNFKKAAIEDDSILIVANNKIFTVYLDGFVKETDNGCSNTAFLALTKLIEDDYEFKDDRLLVKAIDLERAFYTSSQLDIVTVNDKDFKVRYYKR